MSGKKSYEEPNRERDRQTPGRKESETSGSGGSDRDFGGQRRHEDPSKKSEPSPREPRS